MPTFITLIVPDDKVDEVIAALPIGSVRTTTALTGKECATDDHKAWAMKYALPAATILHEWWRALSPLTLAEKRR